MPDQTPVFWAFAQWWQFDGHWRQNKFLSSATVFDFGFANLFVGGGDYAQYRL